MQQQVGAGGDANGRSIALPSDGGRWSVPLPRVTPPPDDRKGGVMAKRDSNGRFVRVRPEFGPCIVCGKRSTWNARHKFYRCFQCALARMSKNIVSIHERSGDDYDRWREAYAPWMSAITTQTGERYDTWRGRWVTGTLLAAGITLPPAVDSHDDDTS